VPRIIDSKPLLWALLAVPAALTIGDWLTSDGYPGDYLHGTGEWSARLIILALMLTPLSHLLPGKAWVGWLLARRRAFGVAAFGYALLHLAFYLADMGALRPILAEFWALGIWTGWAAFLLLVPLALTSNQRSMRVMKAGWKRLQRLAYPAALLTLVHWMFVHDGLFPALVNFAPLVLLQAWRVLRRTLPARAAASTSSPTY
jgi:methionine sulfoxide reductase heme-binding subunit